MDKEQDERSHSFKTDGLFAWKGRETDKRISYTKGAWWN